MNDEPDFTQVISSALAKRQAEQQAGAQTARDEQTRLHLNFGVVEKTLATEVLPVLQVAARQLTAAGGYARLEETKVVQTLAKSVVLVASLNAAPTIARQPPQTYQTLRYEGDPDTLAFIVSITGQSPRKVTLPDITSEEVTRQVTEFLTAAIG